MEVNCYHELPAWYSENGSFQGTRCPLSVSRRVQPWGQLELDELEPL